MHWLYNKELKTNEDNIASVYSFAFCFEIYDPLEGVEWLLTRWVYFFWVFFLFFLTSDLSSWASDLFHLLALCLVSKKVSVKYCTKFVLLKLSLTVETDHLPSTVVHGRWICSGGSEVMGLHVTFFVPFPGWMFISKYYYGKEHSQSKTCNHLCEPQEGHFCHTGEMKCNKYTPVPKGALSALFAWLWPVLYLSKTVMSHWTWYGF